MIGTGAGSPLVLVVLGSSSAAGVGASNFRMSWVTRYASHLSTAKPGSQVHNLSVAGHTTYQVMPSTFKPPLARPAPDAAHNITHALALKPSAIILSFPTGDVAAGYAVAEVMSNLDALVKEAAKSKVPVWITTSQPRQASPEQRQQLADLRRQIMAKYADRALDFWAGLAKDDGTIKPEYAGSDGVAINDGGHTVLYERLVAANLPVKIAAAKVAAATPPPLGGPTPPPLPRTNPPLR